MDSDEEKGSGTKRQRVTQACDVCRKKKIKCDAGRPSCKNCLNYRTKCVYTEMEKKPRRKKRAHVSDLESRMSRIENLLEALVTPGKRGRGALAVSDHEPADDSNDVDNDRSTARGTASPNGGDDDGEDDDRSGHECLRDSRGPESDGEWTKEDEGPPSSFFIKVPNGIDIKSIDKDDLFNITCSRGSQEFVPNMTPLVLFSSKGMKWLSEKSEDESVGERVSQMFTEVCHSQVVRLRSITDPDMRPRPLDGALVRRCATMLQLGPPIWRHIVKPSSLEALITAEFSEKSSLPHNGYAEKLVLNALVALVITEIRFFEPGCQWTDEEIRRVQEVHIVNCFYYRRCLHFLVPSITALQGLVLLMVTLQCSSSPHPVSYLTRETVQLARELGLNRREAYLGTSAADLDTHLSLWWIVYIMDRDVASKIGRGPTISDIDVSAPHPLSTLQPLEPGDITVDLLCYMVDLFKLYQAIFDLLYSASASQKQPAEIVRSVGYCDDLLEKWRDSLPQWLQPKPDQSYTFDHGTMDARNRSFYRAITIIHLHFNYYRMQSLVHCQIAYRPSWVNIAVSDTASGKDHSASCSEAPSPATVRYPRLFQSMEICSQAARTTLNLYLASEGWPVHILWGSLYFVASAYISLFIKCVAKPRHVSTRYDLNLLGEVTNFMQTQEGMSFEHDIFPHMRSFMAYMRDIAHHIVSKAQSHGHGSSAGSSPGSVSSTKQPSTVVGGGQARAPTSIQNLVDTGVDRKLHPNGGSSPYGPGDLGMLMNAPPGNVPTPHGHDIYGNPPSAGSSDGSNADLSMMQGLFQFPSFLYTWDQDLSSIPWHAT